MLRIGFSTGALAFGDFRRGLDLQRRPDINAVELSALREEELDGLISALPRLDLTQFCFRSFHAPSRLINLSEFELVERLRAVVEYGFPVVIHPDIIDDVKVWQKLGSAVLLENMDQRKRVCRTAMEMEPYFDQLPEARLCFDIGHARQVDPTMSVAIDLLLRFRDRLAEIHISEVNWECRHTAISSAAALAFWKISSLFADQVPIIIESLIKPDQIDKELGTVRRCLRSEQPIFSDPPTSELARI
jgi:hypothetical protein